MGVQKKAWQCSLNCTLVIRSKIYLRLTDSGMNTPLHPLWKIKEMKFLFHVIQMRGCYWEGRKTICWIIYIVKWYMKCFIYWTADLKSSQLWTQFQQLCREAWKSQDFNGVWTRDLAIPVRRSNQLSYEATDVGSWSFVSSNEPVKHGCEVIYEMFNNNNNKVLVCLQIKVEFWECFWRVKRLTYKLEKLYNNKDYFKWKTRKLVKPITLSLVFQLSWW